MYVTGLVSAASPRCVLRHDGRNSGHVQSSRAGSRTAAIMQMFRIVLIFIRTLALITIFSEMIDFLTLVIERHQALLVRFVVCAAVRLIVITSECIMTLAMILLSSERDCHVISAVSAAFPTYSFFKLSCCHNKFIIYGAKIASCSESGAAGKNFRGPSSYRKVPPESSVGISERPECVNTDFRVCKNKKAR